MKCLYNSMNAAGLSKFTFHNLMSLGLFSFSLLSPQDLVSFLHGDLQMNCSRVRYPKDAGV